MALSPNGGQRYLLGPGEVGNKIILDRSGRYLAYQLPKDFDSEFIYRGGIGLYDISNDKTRELLYADPPGAYSILGWLREEVIHVEVPTPQTVRAVALDGSVRIVTQLPRSIRRFLRMRGTLLVYEEVQGGVFIVDLQDLGAPKEFPKATEARWTEVGLEVLVDGQRRVVHELLKSGGE